jgi:hypothetical protein
VNSGISKYLEPVVDFFSAREYIVDQIKVKYEFQKNGNEMLVIRRKNKLPSSTGIK